MRRADLPHRRPLFTVIACSGAASLLAIAAWGASAQGPAPSNALAGTYRLVGEVSQGEQTVRAAVDPVLAQLTPDMQRLARARLAESTWVPETIRIAPSPERIEVEIRGAEERTFATTPDQPENVYSRSGVRARLVQRFRPDGGLEQELVAMDGSQHNFYIPQPGGRLNLDVLLRSRRLPSEIRFRLEYQRVGR